MSRVISVLLLVLAVVRDPYPVGGGEAILCFAPGADGHIALEFGPCGPGSASEDTPSGPGLGHPQRDACLDLPLRAQGPVAPVRAPDPAMAHAVLCAGSTSGEFLGAPAHDAVPPSASPPGSPGRSGRLRRRI